MEPAASLVIVNFNTASKTIRLAGQLADTVHEVILVDNASPDGSAASLSAFAKERSNVRLVALDRNRGYGAGANAGARAAGGDVLIVTNPDVEIAPADVTRLVTSVMQPGVALVAPRFTYPDGTLQPSAHRRDPLLLSTIFEMCRPLTAVAHRVSPGWNPTLYRPEDHARSRDCAHVLGAFMAIRKEAFDAVGGFDESFFLYREETDLCRRLRAAGWRVRHVADAAAIHEGGASTPGDIPTMSRPAALRSHYRFIAKHRGRVRARLAWMLGTLGCLLWLVTGPERALAWAQVRWHLGPGAREV